MMLIGKGVCMYDSHVRVKVKVEVLLCCVVLM